MLRVDGLFVSERFVKGLCRKVVSVRFQGDPDRAGFPCMLIGGRQEQPRDAVVPGLRATKR